MNIRQRFATLIAIFFLGMFIYPITEKYVQEEFPFEVFTDWVFSHLILFYSVCGILFIVTICWGIWGNIVFIPWKWQLKKNEEVEIFEIEVPPEIRDKVLGKDKEKVPPIELKGKYVKRKRKDIENI